MPFSDIGVIVWFNYPFAESLSPILRYRIAFQEHSAKERDKTSVLSHDGDDGELARWPRSRPDSGTGSRKVGAPQGRMLANGQSERSAGKCHRK